MAFKSYTLPCGREKVFASRKAFAEYVRNEKKREARLASGETLRGQTPGELVVGKSPARVPVDSHVIVSAKKQGGMAYRSDMGEKQRLYVTNDKELFRIVTLQKYGRR